MKKVIYIGLDVHKDSISIALAEGGRGGEVRNHGKISSDLNAMDRFIATMRKRHDKTVKLSFCYEAGPTGYVLARRLLKLGHECIIVAPSKIPRKSGDRIKTDKRDALQLARLLRADELKGIYIPGPVDEMMRDLCRSRTDAVDDARRAKQRLKSFLLQHGYHYKGKANWSEAHKRYLRELALPHPALKAILEECLMAINDAENRIQRLEKSMTLLLEDWHLKPAVEGLMAFKGFQVVAAMVLISELGNIHRFTHPRQIMNFLGLVPSEESTGTKRRVGAITKCGNPHARWMVIESAQHYDKAPKISQDLSRRQSGQSEHVCKVSWRAQNRLHERYVGFARRHKHRNKAIVAMARELVAFIWEALKDLPCYEAMEETTHA